MHSFKFTMVKTQDLKIPQIKATFLDLAGIAPGGDVVNRFLKLDA